MGLIGGMARTAVIAGTATAVGNRVSRRQANRWSKKDQSAYARTPSTRNPSTPSRSTRRPRRSTPNPSTRSRSTRRPRRSTRSRSTRNPSTWRRRPAPAAPAAAPAAAGPDKYEQLRKLGEFHDQGILTDEEFAAQKARILGT